MRILDIDTGRVLSSWTDQVGHLAMSWSDDGRLLAVGSWDGRVFVWDVDGSRLASTLQGHTGAVTHCKFAPGGYLLDTQSWDVTSRIWDAGTGEPLLNTLRNHFPLAFSADGRQAAFLDGWKLGIWDVAHGEDVRTINPDLIGNRTEPLPGVWSVAAQFSPDGRLAALATRDGVHLHDPDSGRELAHLQAGFCETVLFAADNRTLITCGAWGLYRWPIGPDPADGAETLRLGPPELLREATSGSEWYQASWLADYHTVAMIDNANAGIVLVDSSRRHPHLSRALILPGNPNHSVTSVAFSPDGQWAALGNWREAGVPIWNLHGNRVERVLFTSADGSSKNVVRFSPDGRWLVSCSSSSAGDWGYYFWEVGTWKRGPFVLKTASTGLGVPAFSPDNRLVALCISPQQIRLADAATVRVVAHLSSFQPLSATSLAFSPDGTKLLASTNRKTVLMWDLRRIREQLRRMDLDWDQPPYAPEGDSTGTRRSPIRSIQVLGALREPLARRKFERAKMDRRLADYPDDAEALAHRGWLSLTEQRLPEAIADLDHLHRRQPDYPDVAWMLGQAYQDGDNPASALKFFGRVLKRAPDDHDTRFQRGLIAFALGRTQQAENDFARVLAADPTRDTVRYQHARALNRLGRYRDALAEVDVLFPRHSDDFALFQLRGTAYDALGEREPARLAWEKAHSYLPKDAPELNKHARIMASGPLAGRDPERALVLARQAVALAPDQSQYLNTLGVALYGVGRYSEAINVLERSARAGRREPDAFDLFFLAMAHHGLGHPGRALTCFDRAMHWRGRNKSLSPQHGRELTAVRAEAEAVLAGPDGDLPADVFAPR